MRALVFCKLILPVIISATLFTLLSSPAFASSSSSSSLSSSSSSSSSSSTFSLTPWLLANKFHFDYNFNYKNNEKENDFNYNSRQPFQLVSPSSSSSSSHSLSTSTSSSTSSSSLSSSSFRMTANSINNNSNTMSCYTCTNPLCSLSGVVPSSFDCVNTFSSFTSLVSTAFDDRCYSIMSNNICSYINATMRAMQSMCMPTQSVSTPSTVTTATITPTMCFKDCMQMASCSFLSSSVAPLCMYFTNTAANCTTPYPIQTYNIPVPPRACITTSSSSATNTLPAGTPFTVTDMAELGPYLLLMFNVNNFTLSNANLSSLPNVTAANSNNNIVVFGSGSTSVTVPVPRLVYRTEPFLFSNLFPPPCRTSYVYQPAQTWEASLFYLHSAVVSVLVLIYVWFRNKQPMRSRNFFLTIFTVCVTYVNQFLFMFGTFFGTSTHCSLSLVMGIYTMALFDFLPLLNSIRLVYLYNWSRSKINIRPTSNTIERDWYQKYKFIITTPGLLVILFFQLMASTIIFTSMYFSFYDVFRVDITALDGAVCDWWEFTPEIRNFGAKYGLSFGPIPVNPNGWVPSPTESTTTTYIPHFNSCKFCAINDGQVTVMVVYGCSYIFLHCGAIYYLRRLNDQYGLWQEAVYGCVWLIITISVLVPSFYSSINPSYTVHVNDQYPAVNMSTVFALFALIVYQYGTLLWPLIASLSRRYRDLSHTPSAPNSHGLRSSNRSSNNKDNNANTNTSPQLPPSLSRSSVTSASSSTYQLTESLRSSSSNIGPGGKPQSGHHHHNNNNNNNTNNQQQQLDPSTPIEFDVDDILFHPPLLEAFRRFSVECFAVENVEFFITACHWKLLVKDEEEKEREANFIYENFVKEGAPMQVNISFIEQRDLADIFEKQRRVLVGNEFDASIKTIRHLMTMDIWFKFRYASVFQRLQADMNDDPDAKQMFWEERQRLRTLRQQRRARLQQQLQQLQPHQLQQQPMIGTVSIEMTTHKQGSTAAIKNSSDFDKIATPTNNNNNTNNTNTQYNSLKNSIFDGAVVDLRSFTNESPLLKQTSSLLHQRGSNISAVGTSSSSATSAGNGNIGGGDGIILNEAAGNSVEMPNENRSLFSNAIIGSSSSSSSSIAPASLTAAPSSSLAQQQQQQLNKASSSPSSYKLPGSPLQQEQASLLASSHTQPRGLLRHRDMHIYTDTAPLREVDQGMPSSASSSSSSSTSTTIGVASPLPHASPSGAMVVASIVSPHMAATAGGDVDDNMDSSTRLLGHNNNVGTTPLSFQRSLISEPATPLLISSTISAAATARNAALSSTAIGSAPPSSSESAASASSPLTSSFPSTSSSSTSAAGNISSSSSSAAATTASSSSSSSSAASAGRGSGDAGLASSSEEGPLVINHERMHRAMTTTTTSEHSDVLASPTSVEKKAFMFDSLLDQFGNK